jgi:Protein of Unknown function (DUF2784)
MNGLWLADFLVGAHLAFILFVVFGGLLALRHPRVALLHVPALVWGTLVEAEGWICPLTPLENTVREQAGLAGYRGGFIEHYVIPVVYPAGLTHAIQIGLAASLFAWNAALYARLWVRWRSTGSRPGTFSARVRNDEKKLK